MMDVLRKLHNGAWFLIQDLMLVMQHALQLWDTLLSRCQEVVSMPQHQLDQLRQERHNGPGLKCTAEPGDEQSIHDI